MAHLPPAIQLAGANEVSANHDYGLSIVRTRDRVRERNRQRTRTENRLNFSERVGGQGLPVLPDDHHVGAIIPELGTQLGLHVDVEVHHRGGDSSGDDHGKQRRGSASAAKDSGAQQHTPEHGYVCRLRTAVRNLLRREESVRDGAHSHPYPSPRRAKTGSNFTARRIAAALPAKVTNTAMAMMIGKSTGSMEICELKMDRPIWRASNAPAENPAMPPASASSSASAKKIAETATFPAPRAFIRP